MNITLDLTLINAFFALPADEQIYRFLLYFGWIPIVWIILIGARELWINYIQDQWGAKQKSILLAIDVQKANEQSLKAVENLFIYFAGAHGSFNLIEKYWEGKFQLGFSFEIVSIEGYTQFLIRTPEHFRNLTETAVYSQYPDAEITEVDDYTEGIPKRFPNDEYDIWGAEFVYAKNEAYPIKTYKEFEDPGASRPEHNFKDPMAPLMDLCSTLGPGEQLWYQILVTPTDLKFAEELNREVSKLLNEKVKPKESIVDKFFSQLKSWIDEFTNQIFNWSMGSFDAAEKADDSLKMMNLKPQQKKKIEAVQNKISKNAFKVKNRMIYVARKEVKNNPKVVNGFVGYMKQFTDIDLNSLKPDSDVTQTSASYFFKDMRINGRKNRIMSAYCARSSWLGRLPKVFSVEELATLWHFPIEAVVKAPLIQKAPGRKGEPPMSLPFGDEAIDDSLVDDDFDEIFRDDDSEKGFSASPEKEKNRRDETRKEFDDDDLNEIFSIEEDDEAPAYAPKKIRTAPPEPKGKPPSNLPFA